MQDHRKLHIWQRSHALAMELHRATRAVPVRHAPGLVPQLLRAAASVPANIAEGAGQESGAQFARFLTIAIASANEVENHLSMATGLGLLTDSTGASLISELQTIRRMTYTLRKRVLATDH